MWVRFANLFGLRQRLRRTASDRNSVKIVNLISAAILLVNDALAVFRPDCSGLRVIRVEKLMRSASIGVHHPEVETSRGIAGVENLPAIWRPCGIAKAHCAQQIRDIYRNARCSLW